jgi:uncharacterized protein
MALPTLLARLRELQAQRPWWVVAAVLLTLLPAGALASRLTVKSSFSELLPDDKPSVIEMRRTQGRLATASTLIVAADGSNVDGLERFVDALAPLIRGLDPKLVSSVETGTREIQAFFEKNRHLYADLTELEEIHDAVQEAYDSEVQKRSGLGLELDGGEKLDIAAIERRFSGKTPRATPEQPGHDGYYIGEVEGLMAAILVRTPLGSSDPRAFELRKKIESLAEQLRPTRFDPKLRIGFTGNLITSAEQHAAVIGDLRRVGTWGVALVLAVVLLFFMRLRVLLAMGLTIAVGLAWSFAAARLLVGHLNTATGFLVSIVAGNGINFGIIYMARYVEARRDDALDVEGALATAQRETLGATLAAAAAASVAYGSLSITDFRGFRQFGLIGGTGMLLCWAATYTFLPALLVLSERVKPMFASETSWRTRLRGVYGHPFAWLARSFPRALGTSALIAGIACAVLGVRYFAADPMEYDLRKIRNDQPTPTSALHLSWRVDKIVGRQGQDGRAILTDRVDQVGPLLLELSKRRDAAPADQKPFGKILSIFDLLPSDQTRKLELLRATSERIERAHRRGLLADSDYQRLTAQLPRQLSAIGIDDLPAAIARPFIENDGSRGRVVYVVPAEKRSMYDAHYLMQWADGFREVTLPNGEIIRGTGDPVIYADMLQSVNEEAPKAVLLSLGGTLLVILLAFRGKKSGFVALFTLLMGLSWLVGFLALRQIKLNFLNFIALPISIGIGADYALNVLKRRELAGDANLRRVVVETGGAVIVCSLTTTLGYLALLFSINGAVRSFGLAAAAGELTTLLAGVLFLPAALFWWSGRQRDAAPKMS